MCKGQRFHQRVRGETFRQTYTTCQCLRECGGQHRSWFLTEVVTALRLWLWKESVCIRICVWVGPAYKGFRLICNLSNRDVWTEDQEQLGGARPAVWGKWALLYVQCKQGRTTGGAVQELVYKERAWEREESVWGVHAIWILARFPIGKQIFQLADKTPDWSPINVHLAVTNWDRASPESVRSIMISSRLNI